MAPRTRSTSRSYAESNHDGTRQLFYKRLLYKERMKAIGRPHIVDFYFGEKLLFGRVDRYYTPMILKSTNTVFNKFNTSMIATPDRSFAAVNFVADAFKDMLTSFQKAVMTKQIRPDDQFLSAPKVYKAFESPIVKYNDYSKKYHSALKTQFQKRNISVKNFSEFVTHMKNIIIESGEGVRRYPFTMPAYIKSGLCPISVSGLAIEIADMECGNDDDKIARFVNSANWEFYLNTCNDNGFMIDMNAPWRIVADIDTPVMQARAAAYSPGATSTTALISAFYRNGYGTYYANFKAILLKLYNEIRKPQFIEPVDCKNGTTINREVYSRVYTGDQLAEAFPEEYFLRLYCEIRLAEEESPYTEQQQKSLINEAVSLLHATDHRPAVFAFERILNKTFDYRGSISYISNSKKLIEEEHALNRADTPRSEIPTAHEYPTFDAPGSLDQERANEGGMGHPGGGRWVGEK